MLLGLLEPLQTEAEINVDELAKRLGVSRQTIYRDLGSLEESEKLLQIEDGRVNHVDSAQ